MPFTECPLCSKRYPKTFITRHASYCNGVAKRAITKTTKRMNEKERTSRPDNHLKSVHKQNGTNGTCKPSQQSTSIPRPFKTINTVFASSGSLANPIDIPGFYVFHDVFADVHDVLLKAARNSPPEWLDYRVRRAKNYGPSYDLHRRLFLFGAEATRKTYPLPSYAHSIVLPRIRRLHPLLHDFQPNQLAVNYYDPKLGKTHILPHNDCENAHVHTAVVGVSLASSCTFTLILRRVTSGLPHDIKHDITLPCGSVYVMSDESLRTWMHAIFSTGIHAPRISLTFRDISPHRSPTQTPTKE